MTKPLITLCLTGLAFAACDTASADFKDIPATTVTVAQSTFDVRQKGTSVELIRTNAEFAPNLAAVVPRATIAVERATGCVPRSHTWSGEQTIMQVEVDC